MKSTKSLTDAINRLHANRQAKAAERLEGQSDLFDAPSDTPLSPGELATIEPPAAEKAPKGQKGERGKRNSLMPLRHANRDFFLCDMFDYAPVSYTHLRAHET